ncbi:MAG: hypothetical protein KAR42_05370 [candidate division Zixibacteria bacterium]|nr:hypothetical protein [candidate division Zixibacteria bacterium]
MDTEKSESEKFASDVERLDKIKHEYTDELLKFFKTKKFQPKVGELLKIIELQKKISSDSGAEEKFWKLIEQIRREELSHEQD